MEVFGYYLRGLKQPSELFYLFEQMVKSYTEKTKCRVYYDKAYIIEHLVISYMRTSFVLFKDINMNYVHALISQAYQERDWELLEIYARGCCLLISTPSAEIPIYYLLEMWSTLIKVPQAEVVQHISKVFVRAQMAYPEEVDDYIRNHQLSK